MSNFKIRPYGSGSSGNAIIVEYKKTSVLLDAGLPTDDKLLQVYLKEKPLCAIITHEHGDHIRNINLLKTLMLKTYVTKPLANHLEETNRSFFNLTQVPKNKWIKINEDLEFKLHSSLHDTRDPVCVEFQNSNDEKLFYITDTNEVPPTLLSTPDYLILEANHDLDLVTEDNLIKWTRGFDNHLSITKSLDYLDLIKSERLKEVWLHHVSERFGKKHDFQKRAENILDGYNTKVYLASEWLKNN